MRNPIGKRARVVSLILCVDCCFSWVDHVVFLGLIAFKLIERAEL